MTASLLSLGTMFQLGYVTNDLEAAVDDFGERLGVRDFHIVDVGAAAGKPVPHGARIAMAWSGATMVELIQPLGEPAPVYVDDLAPPGDLVVKFNHVGLTVPEEGRWRIMLDRLAEHGLEVAWRGSDPARLDVAYVDARATLGHYVEFIRDCPAIRELMARVPHN